MTAATLALAWAVPAGAADGVTVKGADQSVLAACLADRACGASVRRRAADVLGRAGMAGEGAAIGLSPTVVRGEGLVIEIAAQSIPGWEPPRGVDLVPAIPRVGFGGVGGQRVRVGGGLEGGGALPVDGVDLGYAAGARGGVALGSPSGRQWVGFELDAGYAIVQGVLFDQPDLSADALGADEELRACPYPCTDTVNLVHVGLDTTLALDVDPTAVFYARLGGAVQVQSLDVAADHTVWGFAGLVPRATFGGAYRFDPRALLAASFRFGLTEPVPVRPAQQFPWTSTLTLGWRFGALDAPAPRPPPVVEAPAPAPVEPVAPAPVPKIIVVEHPELSCPEGTLPTGSPPPFGIEGWCVTIDEETNRIVMQGPYVKWYDDDDHIEQRGQYHHDERVGTWVHYSLDGAVDTVGDYVDGLMSGTWHTYWPSGKARSEMHFEGGRQTGESVDWSEDGATTLVGSWLNGERDGVWREYVGDTLVSERTYRDGLLTTEQRF